MIATWNKIKLKRRRYKEVTQYLVRKSLNYKLSTKERRKWSPDRQWEILIKIKEETSWKVQANRDKK